MGEKNEPQAPSAVDTYKNWLSAKPSIRDAMLKSVTGYPIPSVETRVDNFLNQLAHEMKEAAHAQAFDPPSK